MYKLYKNIKIKQIIYRCTYTGTKESDIIFKKTIVKNINKLNDGELSLLIKIFENISDYEIILYLNLKRVIFDSISINKNKI